MSNRRIWVLLLGALLALQMPRCTNAQAAPGTIDGRVLRYPGRQPSNPSEERGQPIAGARIEAVDANGQTIATANSDAKGQFHLELPQGDYTLVTALVRRNVHVDAGKTVSVNLGFYAM
jgi:hypothetical protein